MAHRINTKYQYWKPWISTMGKDKIKEFCENADAVHRTENYSFVYAKEGDAVRIHIGFFGVLKRCVQIILRPFTTT